LLKYIYIYIEIFIYNKINNIYKRNINKYYKKNGKIIHIYIFIIK